MNKLSAAFFTVVLSLTLSIGGISDAEAKRFGGMKSFGSKTSYSKSYSTKSSKPAPKTASQQQAQQQNQTARQTMSKRGGVMGILGGLALGGLLGSLFFGGAFENLNFMDLLVFAGIAFLLFKLFSAKNKPQQQTAFSENNYREDQADRFSKLDNNYLRNTQDNDAKFDSELPAGSAGLGDETKLVLPKDFNEEEFLDGATMAYEMLQSAWDDKELAEIRGLTTDKVFAEIQSQIQADGGENKTEVLNIKPRLLAIREVGNELEASVLFDALLREDQDAEPQQVREVWTFTKAKNSLQPKWFLDGLQQLED